jgi:hypothetical protein
MATSVHSGEDPAAHLSTQQWKSFEMRMRRRRVERLLARAAEACQQGREDTVREAIAEIQQLSPSEPQLPELQARLEALSVVASTAVGTPAPTAVEAPPGPAEITSDVENPPVPTELIQIEPRSPEPLMPSQREDLLFDLPLVDGDTESMAAAPTFEYEHNESRRGLAVAALALLACGAAGYFLGPMMVTLMAPRQGTIAERPVVPSPREQGEVRENEVNAEPAPPVRIAVDEVAAADTTIERPPERPEAIPQPDVPPAVATTSTEPTAAPPATSSARTEKPTLPEASPPAPVPVPEDEPSTPIEKPAAPTPAENVASVPAIPASSPSSSAKLETMAPVAPPPPAPRETASTVARDEEKIRGVLDRYAAAYSRLDAAAASAIFPGVNRRALERAFDGLVSQKVSLGACDVRIAIETAIVDCAGSATWEPKIGGGTRTEPRRWQFRLRDTSREWQIVAAKVR